MALFRFPKMDPETLAAMSEQGSSESDSHFAAETVGAACPIPGSEAATAMPAVDMSDPQAYKAAVMKWLKEEQGKGKYAC